MIACVFDAGGLATLRALALRSGHEANSDSQN
jgi:hypothetical protein